MFNKENLIIDIANNLSTGDLAKKYNKSQTNIRYWLKKFGLKTLYKQFTKGVTCRPPKNRYKQGSNFNWIEIQKDYDNGLTFRELVEKYKTSYRSICFATKRGEFKSRTLSEAAFKNPRVISQETREKMSLARIAYLDRHPEISSWDFFHKKGVSYPEKVFLDILQKSDIKNWKHQFKHGRYQYDFAFFDFKIDVEIDGSVHLKPECIARDKRRDEWSESQGWKVIRFTATEIIKNTEQCLLKLKEFMQE